MSDEWEKEVTDILKSVLAANSPLLLPSLGDLKAWLEREQQTWEILRGSTFRQPGEIVDSISAPLARSINAANTVLSNEGNQHALAELRDSVVQLNNLIINGQYIVSSSVVGRAIRNISKDNKALAATVYFVATRRENENFNYTKRLH